MEIRELHNRNDQKMWDAYVLSHPEATLAHASQWKWIIEKTYGHKSFHAMAVDRGEVVGLVPLIGIKSLFFGKSLSSMPFLDYGGILASDEEVFQFLLGYVRKILKTEKLNFSEMRSLPEKGQQYSQWKSWEQKVTFLLNLDENSEIVWKSFNAKVRNQVRKSEKSGIVVRFAGKERLPDFYSVFAQNMRFLGSPVHSRTFFENILDEFRGQAELALASLNDEVIGGAVVLYFKDTALVPWASSLRKYIKNCPNNGIYWSIIKKCCENGYKTFDFGRSSIGEGTYRFKKSWNGEIHPLHWYFYSNDKNFNLPGNLNGKNQYSHFIKIWQKTPLKITEVLGPFIRKNVSN